MCSARLLPAPSRGHQPTETQEEHRVRLASENPNSGLPRNKHFVQVPPQAAPAEHQPHGPSMTPMEMCYGNSSLDHCLG